MYNNQGVIGFVQSGITPVLVKLSHFGSKGEFVVIKKYEKQILEAYLNLPSRKLLRHQFELEEDYLAGHVSRFLRGERFREEFVPFSEYELAVINPLIEHNKDTVDGQELITAVLLTKAVCNIMNKYRK